VIENLDLALALLVETLFIANDLERNRALVLVVVRPHHISKRPLAQPLEHLFDQTFSPGFIC